MNTHYPRITIAATSSGAGKTTLTLGLILALRARGLRVQPFKAGPDYIDPSYHTLASGKTCRNLDTWMLSKDAVLELFQRQALSADISIIEGVMGLYDGIKDKEEGSSAHLAKILKSNIILLLDARSLSRSAGAIVLGFKEFDKNVAIKGVILNNIGSPTHYQNIKKAIKRATGLPVLGFLPKDKDLKVPERHLGLIPAQEKKPLKNFFRKLQVIVENNIDLTAIIAISKNSCKLPDFQQEIFKKAPLNKKIKIAVARDAAFNFYYQDNLDILTHNGAQLLEFSPLKDKTLPQDTKGIYIGGGFPEIFAKKLSQNTSLRKNIFTQAKNGLPIYAECGGLMYLMKNITNFKNNNFPMVGIFNSSAKMNNQLRGLGYVNLKTLKNNILSAKNIKNKAHLFHWSSINKTDKKDAGVYEVIKNRVPRTDGWRRWNTLASYAHLHFGSNPGLAKNFITTCEKYDLATE